jgi:serine/threonine protein kinase
MTKSGSDLVGKTVLKNYVIRKRIGGGSFGDVYEADDNVTQRVVAIKVEISSMTAQLSNEYNLYQILSGMDGIPQVYAYSEYGKGHVMVMDQMGPSLEVLFRRCGRTFSLKTVLMIADQMLRIIQWVHQCGILHRDIKPHNFLVGRGEFRNKIYLIDFGISAPYLDHRTHEHRDYTGHNGLVGTAQYVSINTHLGDLQSRRDDLESIMYLLIRFLRGSLPWSDIRDGNAESRDVKIAQSKLRVSEQALCAGLPNEFLVVLSEIRRMSYEATPRYCHVRALFQRLFVRSGFIYDCLFDWDEAAAIHKPVPSAFLEQCAARFQFIHERRPREPKSRIKWPQPRPMFLAHWR